MFFWLLHYPSNSMLEFIFDLSSVHLLNIISKNIEIFYKKLSKTQMLLKWPSVDEFISFLEKFDSFTFGPFKNHIYVIDDTEVTIRRPKDKEFEKRSYSPPKQHSLNFLIITLLNGRIIYCSMGFPFPNDQRVWNFLELRKKFINKPFGILGDAGFTFNPKDVTPKISGILFL